MTSTLCAHLRVVIADLCIHTGAEGFYRVTVLLHRLQFAFTISYHYLFPQLTMGLALIIVVFKTVSILRNSPLANVCGTILGTNLWHQFCVWRCNRHSHGIPVRY